MKEKNRVCIAESLYPIMFYLLISTEEQIKKTYFVVDYRIETGIRNRLPHEAFEDITKEIYKGGHKYKMCLYGWWLKLTKFRFLYNADIYGLDFKWYLLNRLRLNYIEDAPNIFNLWETSLIYEHYQTAQKLKSWKKYLRKVIFGSFFRCPVATSDGVKKIYTTASYDKPYLRGKQQIIVDLKKEWENSTEGKKSLICYIFNISEEDVEILKKKKLMLLTQAFYDDKMVTEEEQIEIYRNILSNYNHDDVIIKAHPRDRINYRALFPDILYFDKVVPLQFLSILGVKFTHVVTVSSSSALSFGDGIQIDWYGSGVHPGILKAEGDRTLEDAINDYRKHNKK